MSAPPIPPDLPDVSRDALLFLLDQMREGYTGPITIHLNQGGVQYVEWAGKMKGDQLARWRRLRNAS